MGEFKRILVPLDGSKVGESVLPEVETLAKAFNATIVLLRAYYAGAFPGVDPTESQSAATREAEEYVHKLESSLKAKGFNVEHATTFEQDAAKAILDHCSHTKIDIIAMCTHGHGMVKHWLLGSVAEKVVHHAPVPVFLTRPK